MSSRNQQERLVLAADADRRTIERELHSGVHQYLVALATTVQLAGGPQTPIRRPSTRCSKRWSATCGGRSTRRPGSPSASTRRRSSWEGSPRCCGRPRSGRSPGHRRRHRGSDYAPEIAMTVYLCWLAALDLGDRARRQVTIGVREADDTLNFEIAEEATWVRISNGLRDRVEALGGGLAVESEPGGIRRLRLAASPEERLRRSPPGRGRRP